MSFERFNTPPEVARRLARHAPRVLGKVLDPAVGEGALLAPLAKRLLRNGSGLYCIDSDPAALSVFKTNLESLVGESMTVVKADFVKWAKRQRAASFDCIIMNPPFAGTKQRLRRITPRASTRQYWSGDRCMPLEAAFLCRAHDLLKDGGRLLAVLPSSVVMAESLQWLRDLLMETGRIRVVHELPADCFSQVGSRTYLLVYDKTQRQSHIGLYNHDLKHPTRIELPIAHGERIDRLDFGHHHAKQRLETLVRKQSAGWCTLGRVASIFRGDVSSPGARGTAVHTVNYKTGFWRRPEGLAQSTVSRSVGAIRKGDLLVKRVGRNSYKSFGRFVSALGMRCSDCVFIVRPKNARTSIELLFALMTLSQLDWVKPLVERGTGASYITKLSLTNLLVPTQLAARHPQLFERFVEGQRRRAGELCLESARSAAQHLERHCS